MEGLPLALDLTGTFVFALSGALAGVKRELDLFVDAMISIAKEAEEEPETVTSAPHSTRIKRVDEVLAARRPVLRWKPGQANS